MTTSEWKREHYDPEAAREWRKANAAKLLEKNRRYRAAHPDEVRAYHAAYREAHREKRREWQRRYLARKKALPDPASSGSRL